MRESLPKKSDEATERRSDGGFRIGGRSAPARRRSFSAGISRAGKSQCCALSMKRPALLVRFDQALPFPWLFVPVPDVKSDQGANTSSMEECPLQAAWSFIGNTSGTGTGTREDLVPLPALRGLSDAPCSAGGDSLINGDNPPSLRRSVLPSSTARRQGSIQQVSRVPQHDAPPTHAHH